MSRLTLPSGAWIELRDPNTVMKSERDAILDMPHEDGETAYHRGQRVQAIIVGKAITAWSFEVPLPPPVDADFLAVDWDAMLVAIQPLQRVLLPGTVAPESPLDPKADSPG